MNEFTKLRDLTEELLKINGQAIQFFEESVKENKKESFENVVLPFADRVKAISEEWAKYATVYIKKENPKYFHTSQVENVVENLQIQAISCFQGDTRKKRFLERNKSIEYTLDTLQQLI